MNKVRAFTLIFFLTVASGVGAGPDCLRFLPIGVCVWLLCVGPYCTVETSVQYGHFNPDLIVTVENPNGVNRAEDPYRIDTHNRNHTNLIYRDVNAFGHPLAGRIYCPSQAEAFFPYFISELDTFGWRWGVVDALYLASYIPGLQEIGHFPFNTWGNVYPRTGWGIQSDEPKAAAVVAHRAGDIITRDAQPHIYYPLTGVPAGDKLTFPPLIGLTENTNQGGDWELIQVDTPGCQVFGENDTLHLRSWGGGKVETDGDYTFTLWRPYKCCDIKGETLLFLIELVPYPLPDTDVESAA